MCHFSYRTSASSRGTILTTSLANLGDPCDSGGAVAHIQGTPGNSQGRTGHDTEAQCLVCSLSTGN